MANDKEKKLTVPSRNRSKSPGRVRKKATKRRAPSRGSSKERIMKGVHGSSFAKRSSRTSVMRSSNTSSAAASPSPPSNRPTRIGILITYPRLEVKKEELISYNSRLRPWTKLAPSNLVVERKFRREKKIKTRHPLGKMAIPTDVSVACYVKHAYENAGKNVIVDMMLPHEITSERLKSNDLNFLLIYDDLEAFHTDKSAGKKIYHNFKKCLEEADNVFPPKQYRELIISKIKYYNYLMEHNVNIAPTITMTVEEYKKMGPEKAMAQLFERIEKEGWPRFICKPVYGMEGIDATFFEPAHKKKLARYFKRCMSKYPGIVVQKAIPDFGCSRKSPELRMYYVGNKYQYSVSANENIVVRPRQEGGGMDTPLESLKRKTRSILKRLPPIIMENGKALPRLLTRLDMGYIVDGKYHPFLNEVEFVPSLHTEYKPMKKCIVNYIEHCARNMVNITRLYVKKCQVSGKKEGRLSASRSHDPALRTTLKAHTLKRRPRPR